MIMDCFKKFLLVHVFSTLILSINHVTGQFQPSLEVTSCLQGKVSLTVRSGVDGGIVYIQGRGPACRHATRGNVSEVEFGFEECNIDWGETFKVVIQRKALYQTGVDKQIPMTCYPNTDDIEVGEDVRYSELDDEPGVSRTTRPLATMMLLRNNTNVTGHVIKLSDNITMVIQLESDFEDDFDISAKSCYANNLQITENGCPVDIEMFPDFTRVRQGKIEASFEAFRPTNQQAGTVTVSFRCVLRVYLGNYTKQACNVSHDDGGGDVQVDRRRRDAVPVIEYTDSVNVTASVDISENSHTGQAIPLSGEDTSCPCPRSDAFIMLTVFLLICVITSGAVIFWLQRKLKQVNQQHRQLSKDEIRHLMQLTSRTQRCSEINLHCSNLTPNRRIYLS